MAGSKGKERDNAEDGDRVSLVRQLRYVVIVLIGGLGAMAISFFIVQHRASDWLDSVQVKKSAQQEARASRRQAEDVLALTREYLDRVDTASSNDISGLSRWIDQGFRTRLTALRRDMAENGSNDMGGSQLMDAIGLLEAMAAQPRDPVLRQEATEAVFEACATVEERAAALGVDAE